MCSSKSNGLEIEQPPAVVRHASNLLYDGDVDVTYCLNGSSTNWNSRENKKGKFSSCAQMHAGHYTGLRTRRKNETAAAPEVLVFMSVAPDPELSSLHGSSFCSFLHINIFNCVGVRRVEWIIKYVKFTKLREYTKLI